MDNIPRLSTIGKRSPRQDSSAVVQEGSRKGPELWLLRISKRYAVTDDVSRSSFHIYGLLVIQPIAKFRAGDGNY
jgi:hypothetical protein